MNQIVTDLLIGVILLLILLAVTGNHIFYFLVVQSNSMEPTYHRCDVVFGYTVFDSVEEGDIVVYEHPTTGENIIHRVVEIKDGRIYTKGDNNEVRDPVALRKDDIKAIAVQRPIPVSQLC